ncbi:MAG: radical SAM protein [Terriglobales bacterium]
MIARALASTQHPVLAHLVAIRRCNLACAYCNEYDKVSSPVPLGILLGRVDRLAELATTVITISGGEPLLHPQLDDVIRHVRARGIISGTITNGYLLTAERIRRLNRAGLDHLQISIDNVMPDEVSKKSLKVLDHKLELLAEHAEFHVNINSVLGGGVRHPEDAYTVAARALELGFGTTIGVIHDADGQLRPLGPTERDIYWRVRRLARRSYARLASFQDNIVEGRPNDWRCRAGGRYLYICEDGLVHYCSQQRGYPAKPLVEYTQADLRREFLTEKPCAPHCTISCVHQVAYLDQWRAPQRTPQPAGELVHVRVQGD